MDTPNSGSGVFDITGEFFYDHLPVEDVSPESYQMAENASGKAEGGSDGKQQTSPKKSGVSGQYRRKSSSDDTGLSQGKRTRASGEILSYLITEFNKNSNPTTQIRKMIAAKTGMPERSVRIWFQNRRAKARKMEKLQKTGGTYTHGGAGNSSKNAFGGNGPEDDIHGLLSRMDVLPIEINEKYSFIESNCVSVGTWQRIRTGNVNATFLADLVNLSPKMIYETMEGTDLLLVLSRKDHEINYFFSGVFQNDKVLFRIFYPLVNIVKSSILNQSQQPGEGEIHYSETLLQIDLSTSPKFAVHFLRDPTTGRENPNQWSICEDFSEGQQVALAHVGEGGSQIGHVITGDSEHLKYLNTYITTELQNGANISLSAPNSAGGVASGASTMTGNQDSSAQPNDMPSSTSFSEQESHGFDDSVLLRLSVSNANTPQYTTDYQSQLPSDQLQDLLLYNNHGMNMNMAVFNGSGTIDSEGMPEGRVDSSGLDLFRNNDTPSTSSKPTTGELDELDLGPLLTTSGNEVKNEYFMNEDGFL